MNYGWRCVYDKLRVDANNVNKTCGNIKKYGSTSIRYRSNSQKNEAEE